MESRERIRLLQKKHEGSLTRDFMRNEMREGVHPHARSWKNKRPCTLALFVIPTRGNGLKIIETGLGIIRNVYFNGCP